MTGYIYNGFSPYEKNDAGKLGATLFYAGMPFFLPFEEVTPIPDFTIRSVDHDKSTPDGESEGRLEYITMTVQGKRIVEELLMTQVPFKNADKGIIAIEGKPTGKLINVYSGVGSNGEILSAEIREVEVTRAEKLQAEVLATEYKKMIVQEYFQSKRERMSGGKGQLHPTGLIKVFMSELNVEDIDDVSRHQKSAGGLDVNLLKLIIEEMRKSNEVNAATLREAIQTVRSAGKAQLAQGKPKASGAAEYKEAYDIAIAEGLTPEDAKVLAVAARDQVLAR